jgi:hypothetical protein
MKRICAHHEILLCFRKRLRSYDKNKINVKVTWIWSTSYPITSHHISSYPIIPHHIPPHDTPSYLITIPSYPIIPHHIPSHLIISHHIPSYPIIFSLVKSYYDIPVAVVFLVRTSVYVLQVELCPWYYKSNTLKSGSRYRRTKYKRT